MNNLIVIVLLVLFGLCVFIGLLVGLVRGTKKAFLRIITLVAALLLAVLITPLITHLFSDALVNSVKKMGGSALESVDPQYLDIVEGSNNPLVKIVLMLLNPLIFIAVFIVLWLLSLITYWILAAIFGKRKIDENGKKKSKGRLVGMLIGTACGFIMFLVTFIPINGYLRVVGKFGEIEDKNGVSVLAKLDEQEIAGFNLSINEYCDSAVSKSLGLGIDRLSFRYLSSSTVKGKRIVLNDEVDVFINAYQQYSEFNTEDAASFLQDPEMLDATEKLVDAIFESKIVLVSIDFVIDYFIENPTYLTDIMSKDDGQNDKSSILAGIFNAYKNTVNSGSGVIDNAGINGSGDGNDGDDENSGFSINSLLNDQEAMLTILTGLKGNVHTQIKACFDIMRVAQEIGLNLKEISTESFEGLSSDSIEKLVNAIFDVQLVRDLMPYVVGLISEPLTEVIGIEVSSTKPIVTDWDTEKQQLVIILQSINSLSKLTALSGGDSGMDGVEEFFTQSQVVSIGELMDALRKSQLIGGIYNALTSFDAEKNEYFIISFLDELIFSNSEDDVPVPVSTRTLRPIFIQTGATKTGGISPNDNIDFVKFNWTKLFTDISDMVVFIMDIKNLENKNLSEASADEIIEMLKKLDELDKTMIKNVLDAFIPKDSGIVIPDLTDIDLQKESEIMQELFDYQAKYDNLPAGGSMSREDIENIIGSISESKVILQLLKSSNATVNASEQEMALVNEILENSDYDEATKDAIKNLFGIGR